MVAAAYLPGLAAFGHLLKGNLGAGCLALPIVYARLGVGSALGLFAVVALQGSYSMLLIVQCKNAVQKHGLKAQSYEDLGEVAFGAAGRRLVGGLVVALQLGVCCIFISLVVTNVHAGVPAVPERAILLAVFCVCALLSLLRDLSDLWPLSTAANVIMLAAIVTAVAVSARVLVQSGGRGEGPADGSRAREQVTFSTIARCLSVQFFAYEGIALVLPVENAYRAQQPGGSASRASRGVAGIEMLEARELDSVAEVSGMEPAVDVNPAADGLEPAVEVRVTGDEAADAPRGHRFEAILLAAMACVALLFVVLGATVARAFPLIDSGSVTAFLAKRSQGSPDEWWLSTVNALVTVAVLLTYPLQLQPAVLIFDRLGRTGPDGRPLPRGALAFVLRRVLITSACAFVVFLIPALDLLIALLGALCQTGLALLPFALSLKLHRLGHITFSRARTCLHVLLALFCGCAMVVGTYCAVSDIAAYGTTLEKET